MIDLEKPLTSFGLLPASPRPQLQWGAMDLDRVLVVRMDGLRNVLIMAPVLRGLRQRLPGASITLLTSPEGSQAAPLFPWINDVIVSEALQQDPDGKVRFNPEREMGLLEELNGGNFDAAFIFTDAGQSPLPAAYTCYLAGIPHRLGFSENLAGGSLSFNLPSPAEDLHQVDRSLSLLQAVSLPVEARHLELRVPARVQAAADQMLRSHGIRPERPFLVLAPGAGLSTRRYRPQAFAEVLRLISAETGLPIVITGTAQETASLHPLLEAARKVRTGRVVSLVGRTSVPDLAAILRRSALVITNNSPVLQIADAFRRPIVALYSGRDMVAQWRPLNSRARLLTRPVHCSPCYETQCPYAMECLDIRPEEVAVAALELLAERIHFRAPVRREELDAV